MARGTVPYRAKAIRPRRARLAGGFSCPAGLWRGRRQATQAPGTIVTVVLSPVVHTSHATRQAKQRKAQRVYTRHITSLNAQHRMPGRFYHLLPRPRYSGCPQPSPSHTSTRTTRSAPPPFAVKRTLLTLYLETSSPPGTFLKAERTAANSGIPLLVVGRHMTAANLRAVLLPRVDPHAARAAGLPEATGAAAGGAAGGGGSKPSAADLAAHRAAVLQGFGSMMARGEGPAEGS